MRETSLSDHKAVLVDLKNRKATRGPNYWQMNASLLYNDEYINGIILNLLQLN